MSVPSKPSNPHPHILTTLRSLPSTTTTTIAHLTRLLSSTSRLDTFLLTSTYTLHLLHALLSRSARTSRLRLTTSLSPLTTLLDEYRTLLRLFGLLSIYNSAARVYMSPSPGPGDSEGKLVRAITWMQLGSIAVFQALENGAFLAGRGVLGWKGERIGRAYLWGARAWMGYVGLEFLRLGVEGVGMRREGMDEVERKGEGEVVLKEGEEKDVVLREREEEQMARKGRRSDFYRRLGSNAAYAPMTVHYSLENGPLSEGTIGALGVIVAWLNFGKAWRESA